MADETQDGTLPPSDCSGSREIPGFPTYRVDTRGRVTHHSPAGRQGVVWHPAKKTVLKQAIGGRANNYKRVMLMRPKKRHAYVHHLMAEAFIGPRPEGLVVLHRDDNGFNNSIVNIRYGTREENEMDRHVAAVAPTLPPAPF